MAWSRNCLWAGVLVVTLAFSGLTRASENIETKYFGSHSFLCDNNDVNLTASALPDKLFWLLPSGKLVSEASQLEKDTLTITRWRGLAYNLTITRINDDDFGYYTCIIRYQGNKDVQSSAHSFPLQVVRWGLNLNGPDFSELRESYRRSAVVGAIAAGVMLGLVGLSCLIWYLRYHKRDGKEEGPSSHYVYENSAAMPMEECEVIKRPVPTEEKGDPEGGARNGPAPTSIDVKL